MRVVLENRDGRPVGEIQVDVSAVSCSYEGKTYWKTSNVDPNGAPIFKQGWSSED